MYQTRARGVSGDGSVIVGEAITVPHTIPEPATAPLLIAGLFAVIALHRRMA